MGSGTTAIAALMAKRKLAKERIREFLNKQKQKKITDMIK